MSHAGFNFEETCMELSKRVFSGHPVTEKERVAHNIYWQYIQVSNRGFRPWLMDCEKSEAKSILFSLQEVGLTQVADLTEKAIDVLANIDMTNEAGTRIAQEDLDKTAAELAKIEQRFLEFKADIESAVEEYLASS